MRATHCMFPPPDECVVILCLHSLLDLSACICQNPIDDCSYGCGGSRACAFSCLWEHLTQHPIGIVRTNCCSTQGSFSCLGNGASSCKYYPCHEHNRCIIQHNYATNIVSLSVLVAGLQPLTPLLLPPSLPPPSLFCTEGASTLRFSLTPQGGPDGFRPVRLNCYRVSGCIWSSRGGGGGRLYPSCCIPLVD